MLRTLERETGIKLEFQREIISNQAGVNTVLFEFTDENAARYLLVIAYDHKTEAILETLREKSLWAGNLFHRIAALFPDNREILSKLKGDVKPHVELYNGLEQPDFSMCRFMELYHKENCINLKVSVEEKDTILPVHIQGDTAFLGTWMSPIGRAGLLEAIGYLFQHEKQVKKVQYKNVPYCVLLDHGWRHNDFFMALPSSVEEMQNGMTKKSRYNIKREKRIIEEAFGGLKLENIAQENVTQEIIDTFYRFKNATHKITQTDYDITKLPITDYYLLKTGDNAVRAIAVSCEQGKDVFIENHTFDSSMREYSFGKLLYEMYIEALIGKGKTGLALAGGSLDYKNRYGTFCAITWSGEVSRSAYRVWNLLRLAGQGNNPLTICRWAGRMEYLKKKMKG